MMLWALRYDPAGSRGEDAARQHRLGRRLLGYAMAREHGVSPGRLTLAAGPHGKPFFTDHPARFSIAHCPGLVCCGLSGQEIGVDCEKIRPVSGALARRVCTDSELDWLEENAQDRDRAFCTLWTLKEAFLKYTGEGMSYGFRRAGFRFRDGRPVPEEAGLFAACWDGGDGYLISVCCREKPADGPVFLSESDLSQA